MVLGCCPPLRASDVPSGRDSGLATSRLGQRRAAARKTIAPKTSAVAATTRASVKAAPTVGRRRSSSATIGGPAVWPMLHIAVTSPVVLAT